MTGQLRACLLPDSSTARTMDISVEDTGWIDRPYPDAVVITMAHGPTHPVDHDGEDYEAQAVGATYWELEVVLPGPLGVYLRSYDPIAGATEVFVNEHGAAAIAGVVAAVGQQRGARRARSGRY